MSWPWLVFLQTFKRDQVGQERYEKTGHLVWCISFPDSLEFRHDGVWCEVQHHLWTHRLLWPILCTPLETSIVSAIEKTFENMINQIESGVPWKSMQIRWHQQQARLFRCCQGAQRDIVKRNDFFLASSFWEVSKPCLGRWIGITGGLSG